MKWDFFICHATEDKERFVRSLADELSKSGLRVWYDEFSLSPGDDLAAAITTGISQSFAGAVVLSPRFFGKRWTTTELEALLSATATAAKPLVPILLDLSPEDVAVHAPRLADRLALKAAEGIPQVAQQLVGVIARSKLKALNREVWVYDVQVAGKMVQMVSAISAEWRFKHGYGLPTEAIFGLLVHPITSGGSFIPENFRENLRFVRFLHSLLARKVFEDPGLAVEAERQKTGYIYLIDRRTPDLEGTIPPEDILGYVTVKDGKAVEGSYRANYEHRLLNVNGFFKLPAESYERALEHAMRERCAQSDSSTPEIEQREPL